MIDVGFGKQAEQSRSKSDGMNGRQSQTCEECFSINTGLHLYLCSRFLTTSVAQESHICPSYMHYVEHQRSNADDFLNFVPDILDKPDRKRHGGL
jgi:hypothetical protein